MNEGTKNKLKSFRDELDGIDGQIVSLLSERFRVTREVGKFKKKNKLPPLDQAREDVIYLRLKEKAVRAGIDPQMLQDIWKVIMTQSKREY